MITAINHFSFTVSDLDISIEFYTEVLGLKLINKGVRPSDFTEKVTGIKGANIVVAYLYSRPCYIELIQYLTPQPVVRADTKTSNVGSSHICFFVDDFDNFIVHLLEEGVVIAGEIATIPAGPNAGRKVAYLEDPDNNTLEFISK